MSSHRDAVILAQHEMLRLGFGLAPKGRLPLAGGESPRTPAEKRY